MTPDQIESVRAWFAAHYPRAERANVYEANGSWWARVRDEAGADRVYLVECSASDIAIKLTEVS